MKAARERRQQYDFVWQELNCLISMDSWREIDARIIMAVLLEVAVDLAVGSYGEEEKAVEKICSLVNRNLQDYR